MTLKRSTAPPMLGGDVWKLNSPKKMTWPLLRRQLPTRSRSVVSTSTWSSVGASAKKAVAPLLSPLSSKGQLRSSLVMSPKITRCKKLAARCHGNVTSNSSIAPSKGTSMISTVTNFSSSTLSLPSPCATPKSPSKRQSLYLTLLGALTDVPSQSLSVGQGTPKSKRHKRLTTSEIDRELQDFLCDNHNVASLSFSSSDLVCDKENVDLDLPGQVPARSATIKKNNESTARKIQKYEPIETPPSSPQGMNCFSPRGALLLLRQTIGETRPVHSYEKDTARVEDKIKLLREMKQMLDP